MSTTHRTQTGIALVLGYMFIFGLADNCVIFISERIGLWQFHAIRNSANAIVLVGVAAALGWQLWPTRPLWVALRAIFFAASMCCYFGAIGFVSVAEAAAGLFTAPLFLLLITGLFLKETISRVQVFAVGIGFAGAMLTLGPFSDALEFSALLPLISGLLYAISLLITRRYCAEEPTHLLVIWFFFALGTAGLVGMSVIALTGEPQTTTFLTRGWQTPNIEEWGWLIFMTAAACCGIPLQARAYQIADANILAIFEYSILVFAGFWAFVLFGDIPDRQEIVGLGLITLAGAILALWNHPASGKNIS